MISSDRSSMKQLLERSYPENEKATEAKHNKLHLSVYEAIKSLFQ